MLLFIFGCAGSSCCADFSLFAMSGVGGYAAFRCGMPASHWSGFSYCRARVLGQAGFSSCGSWALECRLNHCGSPAWLPCHVWDLPRAGAAAVSPESADRFFTTEARGKPWITAFFWTACTLGTDFTFLSDWKQKQERDNIAYESQTSVVSWFHWNNYVRSLSRC